LLILLALVLFACVDKPDDKVPPPPVTATVVKEAPAPTVASAPAEAPAPKPAPQPAPPPPDSTARTPEKLFFREGCIACHGPGRVYAAKLVNARTRPVEEIAQWILHPEKMRPGSMMPSYAKRLSQEEALSLARWIKAGNPAPPASE
jgi:mono/diheme cytochrome c family protein